VNPLHDVKAVFFNNASVA